MKEVRPKTIYTLCLHAHTNLEKIKLIYSDRKQSIEDWGCWRDKWLIKGQKETVGGDGYVHYFDCGFGIVFICQNSLNCRFKYVQIFVRQLCFNTYIRKRKTK